MRLAGNLTIFLLAVSAGKGGALQLGKSWMIAAMVVAGNGLLRLGSEPEFLTTFGNRNLVGAYLAASVVIGVSLGESWSLVGSLMLVGTLGWCHSRGAWLALGIVPLLWFLGFASGPWPRWHGRLVVVLIVLTGVGVLVRPYVVRQWQTDVRPMIWKATVHMVAARPLVGHGLGTYVAEYPKYRLPEYFLRPKASNVTDHAHNELLEVAAEQGLIGLAATLWLWATAVCVGIRACRRGSDGIERRSMLGLLGATLVLMWHGMVDVGLRHLPNQSLLWLLMGLLVGMATAPERSCRLTIHSALTRWCVAVACVVVGIWVAVKAVVYPVVADLRDRSARLAEERGDLEDAAQSAWQALQIQPFRVSTRYFLAGVLAQPPKPQARELAIEECLRIEELAPDYADVTYNLGRLYLASAEPTQALPHLRRAVEINPYNADWRMALAAVLHAVGQDDEALRQVERVLQMQPDLQGAKELQQIIRRQRNP